MREVCDKKNKAVKATDEIRLSEAGRYNGNGVKGAHNGNGAHGITSHGNGTNGCLTNGTSSTHPGASMPDVQETVLAATQTALLRNMPLSAALAVTTQTPSHNGNLRQVDIMQSLGSITVPMQAVEQQIEQLITSPVKVIGDLAAHTMSAGGKRLRPALTLLAAQMCGEDACVPAQRTLLCAAGVALYRERLPVWRRRNAAVTESLLVCGRQSFAANRSAWVITVGLGVESRCGCWGSPSSWRARLWSL
jgi:hypothetical protein